MRQETFQFLIPPSFFERAKSAGLTERETEVMQRVASGEGYKTGADALGIAESTFDNHVQSIHKKLRLQTNTQCILFLLQNPPR